MPRKIQRYGWIPDLPDHRDKLFAAPAEMLQALPPSVDLRPKCPPVYNQGSLGSCTANAIAGALEFLQMAEGLPQVFTPSRLFIYYNERAMEGTVDSDSGAMIRDGIKSVNTQGAPPESLWPYDIGNFSAQPPAEAYQAASQNTAISYMSLTPTLDQLKGCLASGYPFVFGMTVYQSFEGPEVARTGQVPMPGLGEQVVGGHAVLAVGYDDTSACLLVRNSWGAELGLGRLLQFALRLCDQPEPDRRLLDDSRGRLRTRRAMAQSPKFSVSYVLAPAAAADDPAGRRAARPAGYGAPGLVRVDGFARPADGAHREGRHRVLAGGPHR